GSRQLTVILSLDLDMVPQSSIRLHPDYAYIREELLQRLEKLHAFARLIGQRQKELHANQSPPSRLKESAISQPWFHFLAECIYEFIALFCDDGVIRCNLPESVADISRLAAQLALN